MPLSAILQENHGDQWWMKSDFTDKVMRIRKYIAKISTWLHTKLPFDQNILPRKKKPTLLCHKSEWQYKHEQYNSRISEWSLSKDINLTNWSLCIIQQWPTDHIDGVMVSILISSVVDNGFKLRSGHTKDYKIGICCFCTKYTVLKSKIIDWLAWNQDNVSMWCDMSTRTHQTRRSGRLFHLGFNEITQFLSKSGVFVALSVFSSQHFSHQ